MPLGGWILVALGVIALVALAVVAQRRSWIDLSARGWARRSREGSAPLSGMDEVFSPHRYEIQVQQDAESVIPAPAPLPGDPDARRPTDG